MDKTVSTDHREPLDREELLVAPDLRVRRESLVYRDLREGRERPVLTAQRVSDQNLSLYHLYDMLPVNLP